MAEFERFGRRSKAGKNKNPFEDEEEDVDDFTFLNNSKQGRMGGGGYCDANSYSSPQLPSSRQQQIEEEMRRIEERTVQSSERSLGLIYDSEKVGVATAEELVHQREQLQNAETKVDDVNRTLRTTQKHINSIKSVFGGIRNYFSKTPDQPKLGPSNVTSLPPVKSKLESVIENSKNEVVATRNYSHPALRTRGLDSPDWDDDYDNNCDDRQALHSTPARQKSSGATSRYQEMQARLDQNLSEMSLGLGRLKGLASELGTEIEDQNELIDRLGDKVDKSQLGVERQNKQMRQILK